MAEKINLDNAQYRLADCDQARSMDILSRRRQGLWNDASLLRIRAREHVQPSVSDLRMVVRIQRKNKHPHSTKKHK